MAELLLKSVDKIYDGNVKAVNNFNLKIEDQEFIVFVGPSGCGKSTTLRMIAGLEEISAGEIYIDNVLVNDIPPKDRDIAMVFQNYALYPHMSVFENMAFGLRLRKTPKHKTEDKVKEAADLLEVQSLLERLPGALSGGQRQRVAMGRAIVRKPKVFLMDEPLSNLDAKLRVQMRLVISRLYKKLGTTFIYVTHDQTEAMTLGTRLVVMKDGVVQQVDTPAEIYAHPKNLFVAGFIGSPQMNMINGRAVYDGEKVKIVFFERTYEITAEQSARMAEAGMKEGRIVIGIRPEKVELNIPEDKKKDYLIMKGTVELTENLGAESFIHVDVLKQDVVINTRSMEHFENGQRVEIGFRREHMHIFNRETEEAVF